ncbi:MAG: hypothetical protein ACXADU_01660 [Promethearchaeota archaeon]|jgi:hypothetical protein
MNERKDEEFDENGFDPTKDAFFSDLMGMEEEIASEAYEMVAHAISLIESKYYDDGIEVLRQAIGMYTQINREDEIEAISDKIAEVYLLKEKQFRETEPVEEEIPIVESEPIREVIKEDSLVDIEQLLKDGKQLLDSNNFEEALDVYDRAVKFYEEINNSEGIEWVFKLIEECYNQKAEFLRNVKKEIPLEESQVELEQEELVTEQSLKEEKVKQYVSSRQREVEISRQAYDILGKAAKSAEVQQFDEALQLYKEGANLFNELGWDYEVQKVQETINQVQRDKDVFVSQLESRRMKKEEIQEPQQPQVEKLEQQVKEKEEQERQARLKKLKDKEFQKMEDEFFKAQIDNMATEALRMAREYELSMQKAIKKGELVDKCIYPEVIELYIKVRELLLDKGWKSEAAIYNDTVNVYIQKFEQDKKIRQIEAEKVRKQKEVEEVLKISRKEDSTGISEEERQKLEEQRKKHLEVQNLRASLEEMTNKADRLAREYEVALRRGKFELECPYPEIINIYESAKETAVERGWNTDIAIFTSHIQAYKEKLQKDKVLRQIEADKQLKQKDMEEVRKFHKKKKKSEAKEENLKEIEKQALLKEEEKEFDDLINEMVTRAERMARDYDAEMKKAVRRGRLAENPPYGEIIEIYEKVKQMTLAKGREKESAAYKKQVNFYTQKLEKDKNLREIEAKKLQKQKDIDEIRKIDKPIVVDKQRLSAIERKKEEEDFETFITEEVNRAERLVREHETAMRKAMRRGGILESTPYLEVIDIYKQLYDKLLEKGWKEQASIYTNQIKVYEDRLKQHEHLLEVEEEKQQKQKDLEDIRKIDRSTAVDPQKLRAIERKKEEEDFEKHITEEVDRAEKLVREYELTMRKAMRSGEILEDTPYLEVIDIYKHIYDKLVEKGWKVQAEMYNNQINIYQDKLEKHEKLLEVEAKKVQHQKDVEDMYKVDKTGEVISPKMKSLGTKKEEKEFQKFITNLMNKAEKLEREYESALKKALKKGELIQQTPYPEIIEIYTNIRQKLKEKGWVDQVKIYTNQIKIYEEKHAKSEKLRDIEAKKLERQLQIEEMHKVRKDLKPVKTERIKELERKDKEEDLLLDKAMTLIDDAEKLVKNYEVNIKTDIFLYESPYDKAIAKYTEAKKVFQQIGWKDELAHLNSTITFYKEKKEKDEKLRDIERKKLEEPKTELLVAKTDTEKELFAREDKLLKLEKMKKEEAAATENIFNEMRRAERLAQEYELKAKDGIFDYEAPYEDILKIYRKARKDMEEIGWVEESLKLLNTIQFYKERFEKDNRLRAIELEKVKKQEEELVAQKKLLKQTKRERERFLKQREKSLIEKKAKASEFETAKDKAFRLMDRAKSELQQNNFDQAIQLYQESEGIFSEISWQEGIIMVRDSIAMIQRKKQLLEEKQAAVEKKELEKMKIEEKLEEQFAQARELKRIQQEVKREEFLKTQKLKRREEQISEEAYKILEQGTSLLNKKKFEEAHEKYIKARTLFEKISWKREVSRINNELLYKLQREKKTAETLDELKVKVKEEKEEMEALKEETERELLEQQKRKKEEKRKLKKDEFDKKILRKLEKTDGLIEELKYNEGILALYGEKKKTEREDFLNRIEHTINRIRDQAQIPLIALEPLDDIEDLAKFKNAYIALDKAQSSLNENVFTRSISELNEAKFNLNDLRIGSKYLTQIEELVKLCQEKLGRKPPLELETAESVSDDHADVLKARLERRRQERRKKVLDLLKKSKED